MRTSIFRFTGAVAVLVAIAGCGSTTTLASGAPVGISSAKSCPAPELTAAHGKLKADLGGHPFGFETSTLYQGTASTGTQIVFSQAKLIVVAESRGGTFWVRPRSLSDGHGSTPSSPIPSAGTVAAGWARIGAGETVSWGSEPGAPLNQSTAVIEAPTTATSGAFDQIGALDVWTEVQGDLVVVSH